MRLTLNVSANQFKAGQYLTAKHAVGTTSLVTHNFARQDHYNSEELIKEVSGIGPTPCSRASPPTRQLV